MNGFISKPFDQRTLVSTILQHVAQLPAADDAANAIAATGPVGGVAPAWPRVDGIDADDVRDRLGGDVALFRALLARLVDEAVPLAQWRAALSLARELGGPDATALTARAAFMHRLRGSAGMLGAGRLQQAAADAEQACLAGDAQRAADSAARLSMQLERLARSVAALPAQPPPAPAAGGAAELTPQLLSDLIDQLRRQSLSALDRFHQLSPQLLQRMGGAAHRRLCVHIDHLRFSEAAAALDDALR